MNEIQKKLLIMFKWLTKFIDDNNLQYFVVAGTFLGAVRHNGFIPWDDDIDIAMPRPDYIKLIELLSEFDGDYKIETPYENNNDFLYTYVKVYDKSTTLVERQRKNIKRGIYIDIFPLDGAGCELIDAKKFTKRMINKNNFLMGRTCAIRKERKWYKNLFILFSRSLFFINNKKLSLSFDKLASSRDYDSSTFIANFSGAYGMKELHNKSVFGSPKTYKFEDIYVKGPEMFDEYLTKTYGDWKKLPPIESRGKQHDYVSLDLEKSYLEK